MSKTIILEKVKSTEKIVRQIEADNVLVFEVDRAVTKLDVKKEVEDLFGVKVVKVRTHTLKNKKLAYVKLNPEFPAVDVATKLGLM
ncbi:50S ribosomal protein L23 [archaeon]|jgi:large subunit ribosomal protein L23|nr:50S ribosomal protein L23 [archaeon]MBT3578250.1 50S ribosomal protein L23 [archaeon]MBT6819829.1 50S ribosomal protein L23 [archaeon]MBT6956595.1 50S ribosomal protein L23 [archaeon]MBT7025611.1 50S ribosomal protein L23 [archaeon]